MSLNGVSEGGLLRLFKALEKSGNRMAGESLGRTRVDARQRWIADSREKRYVNVSSGSSRDQ